MFFLKHGVDMVYARKKFKKKTHKNRAVLGLKHRCDNDAWR